MKNIFRRREKGFTIVEIVVAVSVFSILVMIVFGLIVAAIREQRRHYVSQDAFLLNDSIGNNIKFYDDDVTEERVVDAAKRANIYDFILKQKEGFGAIVGERGVMLSGGQKQRIALARVLARNPEVLILDEATSSLDNESEALIQKSINDLRSKITILIIAHRLSTIFNVDRLLVLDNGKITEEGTPSDLLKNPDSYFHRIYHLKNNDQLS